MSIGPRRLNRYKLEARSGRGGMAEVWKAFDPQLQRYVAIKILHADLQNDPSFIARFEREAQLIASLHHPNIVQIYDFQVAHPPETEETIAYMVMDYVEGTTLSHYLHSTSHEGNFPSPADILAIFTPICQAVDYAHKKGMIHRDIKPANILLDKRDARNKIGEPILSDFGIAKLLGSTLSLQSNWWLGTPHYTSPEQAKGDPGDERSDIYALAVILYEMCVGALPFQGNYPTTIMMQQINAEPVPPLLVNPSIQPALAAVILRGLAKVPSERFPNASSLGVAIAEALNREVPPELWQAAYQTEGLNNLAFSQSVHPNLTPQPEHRAPTSQPGVGISTSTSTMRTSPSWPPYYPAAHKLPDANRISVPYSPLPIGPADSEPQIEAKDPDSIAHPHLSLAIPNLQSIVEIPTTRQPKVKRRDNTRIFLTIMIVIILVTGSISTLFLLARQNDKTGSNIVNGTIFFVNSGLLNANNSQGINDEILINLHNISAPPPGKIYYGWLLSDKVQNEPAMTALGALPVVAGNIHLLYTSNSQHNNLLTIRSRVLITQENASVQPDSYSPDYKNWVYYGQLSQAPSPKDKLNFTMLDHLRHLLSESPELKTRGLHGGLDIWFLRNTEKILEWANGARDAWGNDPNELRSDIIRILDYLDGKDYVKQDIPVGIPDMLANAQYSQVPLLGPAPNGQDPPGYSFANEPVPGYIYLISSHLAGAVLSPDATPDQSDLAERIHVALGHAKSWLEQAHQDAKQLVALNLNQLAQPHTLALINDMLLNIQYTLSGQIDPLNGESQGGVIWICSNIQRMASFEIRPFDLKTYTP